MPSKSTLYDEDFYAWSHEQAALLRAGELGQADVENIAEEIESMRRTEKRELVSRLGVLLLPLLKWQLQSAKRTPRSEASIDVQRIQFVDHLADNPSLKSTLPAAIASAYRIAVLQASSETGLPKSSFPAICPYVFEQMMDPSFWPG